MSTYVSDLSTAVSHILQRIDGPLRVGAPLGIGKPHRLLNALYAELKDTPARPLAIYTALSLNPPSPGAGIQARFAAPFIARHFGEDFPRLAYVDTMLLDALPAHVQVEEFYMQSGGLLHSTQAQADYTSLNYTHAAAAVAQRAPNLIVQKVAREPGSTRLRCRATTTSPRTRWMRYRHSACRARCWWRKSIRNCHGWEAPQR